MSETLYPYYERELLYVRQLAQEFAKLYPAAAGRLLLEPGRSGDPHIERLIEAFALLTARVHHKLDDEFPELTDALLSVLYPHFLAPVPSMSIVQFNPDPQQASPDGFTLAAGSKLTTPPITDVVCQFRTAYPATLWPVEVTGARLATPPFPVGYAPPPRTVAALTLQLQCFGGLRFSDLTLDTLRVFLAGDSQVVAGLYDLLFNHVIQVAIRSPEGGANAPIVRFNDPAAVIKPVGFERDEGLLPYPRQSFLGYRLLSEFFAFPHKFHFIDLGGWAKARVGFGQRAEIVFFLNRTLPSIEQGIEPATFRLGCTPAVNLFEKTAEPISLTQARFEYKVIPEVGRQHGMEVYAVDGVSNIDPTTGTTTEYQPFYSFRHGRNRDADRTFWYAARRASTHEGDRGTDVFLNLVNLDFNPSLPAESTLVVRTHCTNRGIPQQLQRAGEQLHFALEGAAPILGVKCVRTPTTPLRPPMRRSAYWRLVSHLNLNHLSLADGPDGRDALQEILSLYDFSDADLAPQQAAVTRFLIEGVTGVSSRRVVGRTGGGAASGFARGVEVTLELDEQKYVGTSTYLFASVMERFFGLYAGINSFTQLVAKTTQGERAFKKWPPRAGEQPML